jgi:hypothetical protein
MMLNWPEPSSETNTKVGGELDVWVCGTGSLPAQAARKV